MWLCPVKALSSVCQYSFEVVMVILKNRLNGRNGANSDVGMLSQGRPWLVGTLVTSTSRYNVRIRIVT